MEPNDNIVDDQVSSGDRLLEVINLHWIVWAAVSGICSSLTFYCDVFNLNRKSVLLTGLAEGLVFVMLLAVGCSRVRRYRYAVVCVTVGTLSSFLTGQVIEAVVWRLHQSWSQTLLNLLGCVIITAVPGFVVLIPAIAIRNWRYPQYPAGHCRKCGYSLFGLTGPRCPECGQPFGPDSDNHRYLLDVDS